jgi:hypothetical protein
MQYFSLNFLTLFAIEMEDSEMQESGAEKLGRFIYRIGRIFGFFKPSPAEVNAAVKQELARRAMRDLASLSPDAEKIITGAILANEEAEAIIAREIDDAKAAKDEIRLAALQKSIDEAQDWDDFRKLSQAIMKTKVDSKRTQ